MSSISDGIGNDGLEQLEENLNKWFKEKWVRFGPDGKIRGDCARGSSSEGKPKCLPKSKAQSLGKKGRKYAGAKKRREDPNANRSGKAKNVSTKKKSNESINEGVPFNECPQCRGPIIHESMMTEKQDACYHKVKSRYKVWPSAYASGALVQCRKKGASNWGTGGKKKNESSVMKGLVDEAAFEADLNDNEPRVVIGVYGAKSKGFRKKFSNQAAQDRFFDHPDREGNFEIHYVQKADVSEGDVVQFPKKHPYETLTDCTKCGGELQHGKDKEGKLKICVPCMTIYRAPNQPGVAEGENVDRKKLRKMSDEELSAEIARLEKNKSPRSTAGHGSYVGQDKDYGAARTELMRRRTSRPKPNMFNEGVITQHDAEDPEVAIIGGAGTMSLSRLKKKAHGEALQLADDIANGKYNASSYNMKQLHNTLNTIVAAEKEMEKNYFGEDFTGMFAAEKTPETNPYGGQKDRQTRGALGEDEQLDEKCWKGYKKQGMKTMFGKKYPNCVKNTNEDLSKADVDSIERFADKLYKKLGIDITFTKHFMDRVNDERNGKPISGAELVRLFKKEYERWGKDIAQMGPDMEGTFKDLTTDINLPFVLRWDRDEEELDLIAKTVMRKKNFKTHNQEFPVDEGEEQLDEKCWTGYKRVGMKNKGGKQVPNCVPKESAIMKGLKL